jgi:CRP-like cAMP-binding protein
MQASATVNTAITRRIATILPFQASCRLDGDFDKCSLAGHARIIEAKEHLFEEGNPATHVFLVESGHACVYRLMSDGRRQIVDFAYPGDIVGLGSLNEHDANAMAIERTRVRSYPISALDDIARRDPEFGAKLFKALMQQLHTAREMLLTVGRRTAPERLAAFLLALARREGRNGQAASEIVLPMSRTDIADFLALTIETVSRTFSKFRAEGLINIEQSILITILDADALADLADGCEK